VGSFTGTNMTGLQYFAMIAPVVIALFGWIGVVYAADRRPGSKRPGRPAPRPEGETVPVTGAADEEPAAAAPMAADAAGADPAGADPASADTKLADPDALGRISAGADQQNRN
jgi:hypothetical protein